MCGLWRAFAESTCAVARVCRPSFANEFSSNRKSAMSAVPRNFSTRILTFVSSRFLLRFLRRTFDDGRTFAADFSKTRQFNLIHPPNFWGVPRKFCSEHSTPNVCESERDKPRDDRTSDDRDIVAWSLAVVNATPILATKRVDLGAVKMLSGYSDAVRGVRSVSTRPRLLVPVPACGQIVFPPGSASACAFSQLWGSTKSPLWSGKPRLPSDIFSTRPIDRRKPWVNSPSDKGSCHDKSVFPSKRRVKPLG